MKVSNDLITQFAKITKIDTKSNDATTVRGVARTSDGQKYIQFDGADEGSMTPVDTTVEISDGDRVIATIKDHKATITGNTTDPAVGVKTADGLRSSITQTASEIRLEVENKVEGLNSTISQTASEINTRIENNNKQFTDFKQSVEGFYFTDDKGTVYIDGGSVYAKNLNLTGFITFSDLASGMQTRVTDVEDLAKNAKNGADTAYELADAAYTYAKDNKVTLPSYVKETYIDSTTIKSPAIIGGRLYGVGVDPESASTFSVMDEDGFYIYHNATYADCDSDTYRLIPKMSLTTLDDGSEIRLVLGAGESTVDPTAWFNRFYISKRDGETNVSYVYNWDGDVTGFTFREFDDRIYIHGQIAGYNGVFPIGYVYLSFDDVQSPSELFGGYWSRLEGYFLYAGGSDALVGDTGDVVIEGGTNTAEFIKVAAWRRVG